MTRPHPLNQPTNQPTPRWLFEAGAQEDVRTPNAYGWTPMHSAHWKEHHEVTDGRPMGDRWANR